MKTNILRNYQLFYESLDRMSRSTNNEFVLRCFLMSILALIKKMLTYIFFSKADLRHDLLGNQVTKH